MNTLKPFEQAVLQAVQEPLPLCEQPFEVMAERLGCRQEHLLAEIERLKTEGLIRRYRGQVNYRALGRVAVLVGAAIGEVQIEQAAATVSSLGGVSHNYQRDGQLNLWFTLQGGSAAEIDDALEWLRRKTGFTFYPFAAETIYKLDVRFDPSGPGPMWFTPGKPISRIVETPLPVPLTTQEKQALEAIQQELPLAARPFDCLLEKTSGKTPVELLRSLANKGVLGKIAAVVDYRRLGYATNAMVCVAADEGRIDMLGGELARIPAVTHCYRRQRYAEWPYALYAMFHAQTLGQIDAFVGSFCQIHGAADYEILPTVREFKKKPVRIVF